MDMGMGITGMDGASQSITVVDSLCFKTELTAKLLLCEFFMAPPSALCGSQLVHAFIHVCGVYKGRRVCSISLPTFNLYN